MNDKKLDVLIESRSVKETLILQSWRRRAGASNQWRSIHDVLIGQPTLSTDQERMVC
ncbi:hypothetical protein [Rhodopirellula sp. MGV]|uniref:hypothetical protein n=1 Tax=Rhodopirellula sp. MGV TaxID=2023130 RepID=UPI0013041F38|nr:hypothetical protein [Rhodopirellula sp. MGV]